MQAEIKIDGKNISGKCGEKIGQYLNVDFPCGGHGKCGKCKVKIKSSRLPYSKRELEALSAEEIKQGIHLACITPIQNGMEIETLSADTAKNKIISDGFMPDFEQKPIFTKLGIAIDIGTTTIAAKIYDANGNVVANQTMLNPQSAWGADVISRIEVSIAQGGDRLTNSVLSAIDNLVGEMCKANHLANYDIQQAVITGNTVMLSLLTATSVKPLSQAPFLCERLFGETLSAHTIDNAPPCGICGSGIVDSVACLLRLGLVDETGYLKEDAIISSPVIITPNDIRSVQLSKSAICAGIYTLVNEAGIECDDIKEVYIAGGFGSYLNLANAGGIGLLPKELIHKTTTIGNAALSGATMMLLNPTLRNQTMCYMNNSKVLELSTDEFFIEKYIENMSF